MKVVNKESEFPRNTHIAVLVFYTVHIPGDERSRTHPGHGCPAEDKPVVKYIHFDNEAELEKWALGRCDKNWVVLKVTPMDVQLETRVTLREVIE